MPPIERHQLWASPQNQPAVVVHPSPTLVTLAALANGRRIRLPPSRLTSTWHEVDATFSGNNAVCFMLSCPDRADYTFQVPDALDHDRRSFTTPGQIEPTRRWSCHRHLPVGPSFTPGLDPHAPIAWSRFPLGQDPDGHLPPCPLCHRMAVWNTTWPIDGTLCLQCTTCDYTYHMVVRTQRPLLEDIDGVLRAFPDDLALQVWLPPHASLDDTVQALTQAGRQVHLHDDRYVVVGLPRRQGQTVTSLTHDRSRLVGRLVETDDGMILGRIEAVVPPGLGSFYERGKAMTDPLVLPGTLWSPRQGHSLVRVVRVEPPTVIASLDGSATVGFPYDDFVRLHVPVRLRRTTAPPRAVHPEVGEEWVHRGDTSLFYLVATVQPGKDWIVLYPDGNPAHPQAGLLSDFLRDDRWQRYIRPSVYDHLLGDD